MYETYEETIEVGTKEAIEALRVLGIDAHVCKVVLEAGSPVVITRKRKVVTHD